ncbi:MAG: hypothetical protein IJ191_07215 [Treponema sp.]|nr:hypothetical protein [Treponema sp.]
MKHNFSIETIKNINSVLIFSAAIIGLILLLVTFVQEILPHRQIRNQVEVISAETERTIEEHVDFVTKLRDVFVFSVRSTAVGEPVEYRSGTDYGYDVANVVGNLKQSVYGKKESGVVNLIFISADGTVERTLFSQNVFIYTYKLIIDYRDYLPARPAFSKNLYAVVPVDSNGDGVLNSDDCIQLYVSEYDGSNVTVLSGNVYSVSVVDNNTLVFSDFKNGERTWYEYSATSKNITALKTSAEEPDHKDISF